MSTRIIIYQNSAKCRKCGEEVISKHRHDFVQCKCGAIAVDGGRDYLRRAGQLEDCEETSITAEVPS